MNDIAKLILELADQQINIFLSGGKLKIDAPKGIELDPVLAKIKLHKEEIIEYLSARQRKRVTTIERVAPAASYVLSSSQHRLWLLSQLEEGSAAYHIPGILAFDAALDSDALAAAFKALINRHEVLRTVFRDEEVRQYVLPVDEVSFSFDDWAIEALLNKPFDLANGPLLRAAVQDNTCCFVMHHIISDGWSMEVIKRELLQLYHGGELAPLPLQYKDYAEWQQQQIYEEDEQYWKEQFAGEIPVLELPADKVRPPVKTYHGGYVYRQLDASVTKKLRAFDHTIFSVLLAGVNAFLYRYTGQEDIVIGTPVSGREHAGLEEQIGFYVNTLALRTRFSGADTFAGLLANVKEVLLSAYAHQAYPFDRLVDALDIRRDLSRHPLFDVMVVLQQGKDRPAYDGLPVHSKFDVQFSFVDAGETIGVHLNYNSDIYDGSTIAQLSDHFVQFLSVVNAGDGIGQLDYLQLQPLQGAVIKYPAGKTVVDLIIEQALKTPDLIALQYGDKTFTYREVDELTSCFAGYLQSQYGIVANDLVGIQLERSEWMPLAILGVLKAGGAYVPVGTDYPSERVAFIRQDAGMKVLIDEKVIAGFEGEYAFAYRPSGHSGQDLSGQDLSGQASSGQASSGPVSSGLLGSSGPSGDDLAYCIYTSGSTGTPKGVLNTHAGLYNRLLWMQDYLQVNVTDVFLQKTPYTFDVSVWELILPFMCGSKLVVLPPDQHKDPLAIQEVIESAVVNIIHFVPSMLGAFLPEVSGCTSLKHIVCSGEELPGWMLDMTRQKLPDVRIHNLYGPTEAAIDVTAIDLTDEKDVTIGYPVSNTTISIVNAYDQLQPALVAGELLIGGVQVAKGYLNLPELTADRFREGHYRTGDIARYLPDGRIQYLGRRDNQVKIRGNRIELGEVEAALSSHPEVTQVVAMAREVSGEKVLVAYYTRTGIQTETAAETRVETGTETVAKTETGIQTETAAEIRVETGTETVAKTETGIQTETGAETRVETGTQTPTQTIDHNYLRSRLPGYMLPDYYVQLPSFPLTASGKVDRKLLPSPTGTAKLYIAPRTGVEYKLSKIWEEILGKQAGVKDHFFELGGHSLKATRLLSRIQKEFQVKLHLKEIFTNSTLESQAALITNAAQLAHTASIAPAPQLEYYPLSAAQRRIWTLSQFDGGNIAYNITTVLKVKDALDLNLLQLAIDALYTRHESLRTIFKQDETGELHQYILPKEAVDSRIKIAAEEDIKHLIHQPFDLATGPLFRLTYIAPAQLLIFSLHHIAGDGWSMEIIAREVTRAYNLLKQGLDISLPPLPLQYKDYAFAEANYILPHSRHYWHTQLAGDLPVIDLPVAKPRPAIKTYHGARIVHHFNAAWTQAIHQKAAEQEATLFMTLLAAINGLLYRYTGQQDIVLGTPIAGRPDPALEEQIGLYLNTLPIRTRFEDTITFDTLIQLQKQLLLDAYAHQDYPFDALVSELALKRDTSRSALFDILVVLHNQHDAVDDLIGTPYSLPLQTTSQFDISFSFAVVKEELQLVVSYNTDIYDAQVIQNLIGQLEEFVTHAIRASAQSIAAIHFVPVPAHEENLSSDTTLTAAAIHSVPVPGHEENLSSDTTLTAAAIPFVPVPGHEENLSSDTTLTAAAIHFVPVPAHEENPSSDTTLTALLAASFRENNQAPAILHKDTVITYGELDMLSGQLAYYLLSQYNVLPGDLIGIKLERTEWLPIAIIAVLKAGAAYVPLDLQYPAERIAYIETDSQCRLTITAEVIAAFQHEAALPAVDHGAGGLAYVIYTSGSTGQPKGVMISHENVTTFLQWCKKEFADTPFDLMYAATSHCFDLSVYEMFYPFIIGKPIRILTNGLAIPEYISTDTNIFLNTVPSVVSHLLENRVPLHNVTAINMAGEPIPVSLSNTLCKLPVILRNLYGPTEDTTYSSCYHINRIHTQSLPIGRPIDHTQFYILSAALSLQPDGGLGEICIAGKGLSAGYLNRPALTSEKFVDHPFEKGAKLYRTGDLGFVLPDGNIAYAGRKDQQVKLRGYRIELGEIELAIEELAQIEQAVVLIKEQQIIAYLAGQNIDTPALNDRLSKRLPAYMLPAVYHVIDSIPRTPNGKTDKTALLQLNAVASMAKEYIAPRNDVESTLQSIWQGILSLEQIGITDNFFELGGHSLHITRMLYEINKAFDIQLRMQTVFNTRNIKELAAAVDQEIIFKTGTTKPFMNQINSELWEI